jgi:hypothetical protein
MRVQWSGFGPVRHWILRRLCATQFLIRPVHLSAPHRTRGEQMKANCSTVRVLSLILVLVLAAPVACPGACRQAPLDIPGPGSGSLVRP